MGKIRLNLDPTFQRVCIVAMLLMLELFLTKLIEILASGRQPTPIEIELLVAEAMLIFVTYILTFLQKSESS